MADQKEREQQGLDTPSKYRVTGPLAVFGYAPGSTFEQFIPEEQEAQLIEGGQIAKAAANAKVEEGGEEPQTPAARAEALQVVPETAEEAAALEPEPPATDNGQEG